MYQDGEYFENNPTWHEQDSPRKAAWISSILGRRSLVPRSVAEVGCGAAGILRELSKTFVDTEFEGWDISPQAIELARSRPQERLGIHRGDLLQAGRTWDLLLAIDVLEHMENPADFLRSATAVCRFSVIHLPLDLSVQTVGRGFPLLERRRTLGHIHMFTRATAKALVEENGWEILEETYTAGALELPIEPGWASHFKNIVLRLPRRLAFALAPHLAVRILGGWSILLLCKPKESAAAI